MLAALILVAWSSVGTLQNQWVKNFKSIHGGEARDYMGIKDIRRLSGKKVERLEFELGTATMGPISGPPGFYHVEQRQNPPRLIITFSRTLNSNLETKTLTQKISGSLYIRSAKIEYDRSLQNMRLVVDLKKKLAFKVREVPGNRSFAKLQVDLADF